MVQASLNEKCRSWKVLLQSVCNNLLFFSSSTCSLPQDWRIRSLKMLVAEDKFTDSVFLKALFKTASSEEMESMMHFLLEEKYISPGLWIQIILADVDESCLAIKREAVERAVERICSSIQTVDPREVSDLLRTIFTSSPPCVSQQLEICCLGGLQILPPDLTSESLSSLSVFISHRSSTKSIPIILSIIRHCISQ